LPVGEPFAGPASDASRYEPDRLAARPAELSTGGPLKVAARPVECHYFGVPPRLLAIAVIVGFATACTGGSGGDPKPSPSPTTRPTTSIVTSPSPTPKQTGPLTTGPNVRPGEKPPQFPAHAKERTQAGALQFAGYYFKAFDWGYATNDPSLVEDIALPTCRGCKLYINGLLNLKKSNGYLTGGRIRIRSASVFSGSYRIKADYAIDVGVDEEPVLIHSQTGSSPSAASKRYVDHHSLVFVRWTARGWKVAEVTAVP